MPAAVLRGRRLFDDDGVAVATRVWGVAQDRGIRLKLAEGARAAMRALHAALVHRNVDLVNPQRDPYDGD